MKKLLLILLCLPMIGFGQQTYVPDDNFEAYLESNGMGNGIANDDSVTTDNIEIITNLYIQNQTISNLTGIEDFSSLGNLNCINNNLINLDLSQNTALYQLACSNNQLTNLDLSQNIDLDSLDCSYNQLTNLDLRNGNNSGIIQLYTQNNVQLYCINVDDAAYSNTNWASASADFVIDSQHYFSDNCPMGNLNCLDSLLITEVIINNTNLTMNIAIYNGYNSFLNYPHVAFTIDANGDTIQIGNINLFGAFYYDTTWYNYSISSQSLLPIYPITSYFVYTNSLTFMSDTCALTFNSTTTTGISDIGNSKSNLVKITDMLGQETPHRKNTPLFYIYDDGTVEKRIVIE